jgi:ABC-type bacteriocin/lantibiotic exporter with double-glycine peptidase domain
MTLPRSIAFAVLTIAPLGAAAWLDVPFVRQPENGCGSAALAMVQDYWHLQGAAVQAADHAQIFRALYEPAQHGIAAISMTAYLEQAGFTTYTFGGTWVDLESHVAKGRPLIVALDGGRGRLHYAVVTGVSASTVSLNDPADRKLRQYSRAAFEKKWSATQRWTLLAVPTTLH